METKNKATNNTEDFTAFQIGVLDVLEEYDYTLADITYIESIKQLIVTMKGIVLFVTETEISMSFEVSTTPDVVGNLVLILSEKIPPKSIHITDSFIISLDDKGKKIAVFGDDAQSLYRKQLKDQTYDNKFLKILTSEYTKFYNC